MPDDIVIEISAESRRGCGHRRAGERGFGIYLCGSLSWTICDRLPFPFEINGDYTELINQYISLYLNNNDRSSYDDNHPVLVNMVENANYRGRFRFSRQLQKIDLRKLFDKNLPTYCNEVLNYTKLIKNGNGCRFCYICNPDDRPAYIEWIGKEFYDTPNDFRTEVLSMGLSRRISHIPKDYIPGKTVLLLAHVDGYDKNSPGIFLTATPKQIDIVVDTESPKEIPEDALKIKEKYGNSVRFVKVIPE